MITRLPRPTRLLLTANDGAVAPMVALSIFGLIGAGVLAFDYSRMVTLDTELQNAADQAALAAATQLQDDGSCDLPTQAARELVANGTQLSNDGDPLITVPSVVCANDRVTVTVQQRRVKFSLMDMDQESTASARAGLGSAICKVPPLMICNPLENVAQDFDPDSYRGRGLRLVQQGGGGGQWAPGNFGFLDVGADNVGNPDLFDALGKVNVNLECVSVTGVNTNPGLGAAFTGALNTRFDIYENGWARQNCGINSAGSGISLCPPALNVSKDLVRDRTAATENSCNANQGWAETAKPYWPSPTTRQDADGEVDAMGHPRDICHAISEDGDCPATPTPALGDGNWDRQKYFQVNHPGNTTWQSELGATPTRYDVYKWEILRNQLGWRDVPNNKRSYKAPICAQGLGAGTATADRRVVSMAVINCGEYNVNGNSRGLPVETWADVFLVEPSIRRPGRTRVGDLYVEIVGKTHTSGNGNQTQLIRRDIPYLIE